MNKASIILIATGILVLAAVGYFLVHTPATEPSTTSELQTIATLEYRSADPTEEELIQVKEGQHVIIKVTADVEDEVHLHGYDLSAEVKPETLAVIEFDASKTGRFEIELENRKIDIGVIEVYPR